MDRSLPRPPGPEGSSSESPPRRDTIDSGPIPKTAEETQRTCRMGRSQISLWNCGRIALLVRAVIVLTWLPILGPPRDATPTKRALGVGDAPILAFAFAPRGETIGQKRGHNEYCERDGA